MITFAECAQHLSLPATAAEHWEATWNESGIAMPCGAPAFVQDNFVDDLSALSGLGNDARAALHQAAAQIRNDPYLARLAWHVHWLLYLATPEQRRRGKALPPGGTDQPAGNVFLYALAVLGDLPRLRRYYRHHHIDDRILADTIHDFAIWTDDFFQKHGHFGCSTWQWLSHHLKPDLFRLNRLQFQFSRWKYPYRVYQHWQAPQQLAIFPNADLPVNPDGFFCQEHEAAAVTTRFQADDATICGHAVMPNGLISLEPTTLRASHWRSAIAPNDLMLAIHIPAGEALTPDGCKDALRQARQFFPRHFPEYHFKGFCCGSWLFDPQLGSYLPPDSNIVQFQAMFHLFPALGGNDWQIRERVFGNPNLPLDAVPQRSSLQRAVLAHIRAGKAWRSGCAVAI
ncbi:MAG: acyltransferase domain-containing protein [Lentisphaeria bacterium]|nr:acyltransferase domain-containing protein [Lentisphaeria bacterium]